MASASWPSISRPSARPPTRSSVFTCLLPRLLTRIEVRVCSGYSTLSAASSDIVLWTGVPSSSSWPSTHQLSGLYAGWGTTSDNECSFAGAPAPPRRPDCPAALPGDDARPGSAALSPPPAPGPPLGCAARRPSAVVRGQLSALSLPRRGAPRSLSLARSDDPAA